MKLNKAVFLDRDGTIIFDENYIRDPAQVRLLPGASKALSLLRNNDYRLFLFTNQSGVGRGHFPLQTVHDCNQRMLALLGLGDGLFSDVCIATEHPDEPSVYRKPNPRFILECIGRHDLGPSQCWMVGDKSIDVEAGLNAGINAALIGPNGILPGSDATHFPSLLDFAQAITKLPAESA